MHISKIDTIKPESVAFVAYVMSQEYGIDYDRLDVMVGLSVPFLKTTIKGVMLYGEPNGKLLEVAFIYAPMDKGMASGMMTRVFDNGALVEDSLTLLHFVMRPFARETVEIAMRALPPLFPLVDAQQAQHSTLH